MPSTLPLALLVILFATYASAEREIAIGVYLDQLAAERGFELRGLSQVGAEAFPVPSPDIATEKAVARALERYNHFVQTSDNEVRLVVILGRKGIDVGELPEDYVEPAVVE